MRKTVLTALIIVSSLLTAKAGNDVPANNNKEVAVTSLGVTDGEMVFNLKYDNVNEDKLSIVLSDEHGLALYKEIVDTKNVNKTFRTLSDIGTIFLTVTNTKNKTKQKFEISSEKRLVEEVMITNVR